MTSVLVTEKCPVCFLRNHFTGDTAVLSLTFQRCWFSFRNTVTSFSKLFCARVGWGSALASHGPQQPWIWSCDYDPLHLQLKITKKISSLWKFEEFWLEIWLISARFLACCEEWKGSWRSFKCCTAPSLRIVPVAEICKATWPKAQWEAAHG